MADMHSVKCHLGVRTLKKWMTREGHPHIVICVFQIRELDQQLRETYRGRFQ